MCKCEALQRLFEPDIQAAAEAATKTATEQRLKQDISICIGRFRKIQIPRNDVVKIIAEDYSMNEKKRRIVWMNVGLRSIINVIKTTDYIR